MSGRRGLSRKKVAMKSPSPRASGAGSKQPTKRTSVMQKAKRGAVAERAGIGARTPTKGAGMGRKVMKKASGAAARRASKTGATRKRVHVRH